MANLNQLASIERRLLILKAFAEKTTDFESQQEPAIVTVGNVGANIGSILAKVQDDPYSSDMLSLIKITGTASKQLENVENTTISTREAYVLGALVCLVSVVEGFRSELLMPDGQGQAELT